MWGAFATCVEFGEFHHLLLELNIDEGWFQRHFLSVPCPFWWPPDVRAKSRLLLHPPHLLPQSYVFPTKRSSCTEGPWTRWWPWLAAWHLDTLLMRRYHRLCIWSSCPAAWTRWLVRKRHKEDICAVNLDVPLLMAHHLIWSRLNHPVLKKKITTFSIVLCLIVLSS